MRAWNGARGAGGVGTDAHAATGTRMSKSETMNSVEWSPVPRPVSGPILTCEGGRGQWIGGWSRGCVEGGAADRDEFDRLGRHAREPDLREEPADVELV
jgi:hypothetical protein